MSDTQIILERAKLLGRTSQLFLVLFLLLIVVFIIGMIGFWYFFNFSLIDAFFNTALATSTLSLGLNCNPQTTAQKVFVGLYALIAGILFISIASHLLTDLVEVYEYQSLVKTIDPEEMSAKSKN